MKKPPKTVWVNVYKKSSGSCDGYAHPLKKGAVLFQSLPLPASIYCIGTFKYVLAEKEKKSR